MTIGIDIRALIDRPLTGVGNYTRGMIGALLKLKTPHRFEFLISGTKVPTDIAALLSNEEIVIRHAHIPNKILNAASYMSSDLPFRKLTKGLDYVWLPNINFFTAGGPAPYAVTVHDLSFLHEPAFFSVRRRIWHASIRLGRLLDNAKSIIAVSENTKHDIRRFFPQTDARTIHVVYPATDIMAEDAIMDKKTGLPRRYMLFIGTLEPRKNIEAVIKAFRIVAENDPEIHLIIAGNYGWSSSALRKAIADGGRITWLRYAPNEIKRSLYANAELFVWPSFYEGFGLPPLESLLLGTPVITSYRTSLPEVFGDRAFYVNPYNHKELARIMMEVLRSKAKISALFPAEKFSWDTSAQKLLTLMTESL